MSRAMLRLFVRVRILCCRRREIAAGAICFIPRCHKGGGGIVSTFLVTRKRDFRQVGFVHKGFEDAANLNVK